MAKIKTEKREDGDLTIRILCPACEREHYLKTTTIGLMDIGRKCWGWNRSYDKPTLHPSLVFENDDGTVCHSWIRDGFMIFLGDSTAHSLGGHELPMLEIEE